MQVVVGECKVLRSGASGGATPSSSPGKVAKALPPDTTQAEASDGVPSAAGVEATDLVRVSCVYNFDSLHVQALLVIISNSVYCCKFLF